MRLVQTMQPRPSRRGFLRGAAVAGLTVGFVPVLGRLATKVAPLSASRQNSSSNDIGDITWVVPSATVRFPSAIPGVQAHHWTAGIAPTMSIAHKGAVVGAKVMAASVLDLLTSAELLAAAKKQFEQDTRDTKYFSLLPPGAKPPVDLNKDMMDRYRPAMRQFYLNKKAQFK